ncbi:hypothetical protein LTR78_004794 [Recurvomyces mirabilis]|uniref:Uncharacterized protein n=1 Tax=Recurvomyces mirabilis TaxID=574656 RepID=A0AAE0WP43_9PEZI|nr:hypothetical protein LTR78_004794 [Recurvomyces mirabilis]KAK5157965.1 hypothetical protein LTS14_003888 [Recurvomyces mirabilis]
MNPWRLAKLIDELADGTEAFRHSIKERRAAYDRFLLGPTKRWTPSCETGYRPEVRGGLNGLPVSCFPDYGAGRNVLSLRYAKERQLPINRNDKEEGTVGNGERVFSLGSVRLPFHFDGEIQKAYIVKFQVWKDCIHNVVLGSDFLRAIETFTQFRYKIRAMPDTGSDVMLMSQDFAHHYCYTVDASPRHRILLQFANGSYGWTTGIVREVSWAYGESAEETLCDFYVLPNLKCDVLLSYDFLEATNAFQEYSHCLSHTATLLDWALCTITKMRKWLGISKKPPDEAEEELLQC